MNKTRLLTLLTIGLIAINIGLLIYIFLRPDGRKTHEGPRNEIIEKLHFDESQIAKYDELISLHRQAVERNQNEMMQAKNALYHSLAMANSMNIKDSCIQVISNLQQQIEEVHYNHFESIRALCNPNQIHDFDVLSEDLAKMFSPQHPPKRAH